MVHKQYCTKEMLVGVRNGLPTDVAHGLAALALHLVAALRLVEPLQIKTFVFSSSISKHKVWVARIGTFIPKKQQCHVTTEVP